MRRTRSPTRRSARGSNEACDAFLVLDCGPASRRGRFAASTVRDDVGSARVSSSRLVERTSIRPALTTSNRRTRGSAPPRHELLITWILVLVSVLSWRNEAYYSGGLDAVVVAKALLSVVALVRANSAGGRARQRSSIGIRSLLIIGAYLAVTVLGGWASSALLSSAVL